MSFPRFRGHHSKPQDTGHGGCHAQEASDVHYGREERSGSPGPISRQHRPGPRAAGSCPPASGSRSAAFLSFPLPLGRCTRRTGGARYAPDFTRSRSEWRLSFNFASYSRHVWPSTPAAASLRVRLRASRSHSTSMCCDKLVSATCGIAFASSAIRRSFVDTVFELGVSVILLSCGSFTLLAFAPHLAKCGHVRPGLRVPVVPSGFIGWRSAGLPGSWTTPMRACPALWPRWDDCARPARRSRAALLP